MRKNTVLKAVIVLKGNSDIFVEVITIDELRRILGPQTKFQLRQKDGNNCFLLAKHTTEHPDDAVMLGCGPSVSLDTDKSKLRVGLTDEDKIYIFTNADVDDEF